MRTSLWRVCLACTLAFAGYGGGVKAQEAEPMGTVIGIDLGTTYSCVGVFKGGRVEIIANDQGNRITPSYVAWDSNGERLIGDAAKNQATVNPETTVFDVKRLIGRQFGDKSVQADMKLFPFKIINKENKPQVQVSSRASCCYVGACFGSAMIMKRWWCEMCFQRFPRVRRFFRSLGAISILPGQNSWRRGVYGRRSCCYCFAWCCCAVSTCGCLECSRLGSVKCIRTRNLIGTFVLCLLSCFSRRDPDTSISLLLLYYCCTDYSCYCSD